jgi:nickel-type superoxide dismutase maturation protease
MTAIAGAVAVLARRSVRFAVMGESMTPTLAAGDWVLARRTQDIQAGQIVVAARPDRPGLEVIKRVESVEGSRVMLAGDNPSASTDSREFGPVAVEAVVGVVWLRYWPLRRVRLFRRD